MHLRSLKSIFRHQEYVRSRVCNAGSLHYGPLARRNFKQRDYFSTRYCNRRNFHTRFDFAYFVLLAESTKVRNFSRIRKPCMYRSECDTALTERKFIAYKSSRTLEYEIFTGTKLFCDYSSGLQAVQRCRLLTHDRS